MWLIIRVTMAVTLEQIAALEQALADGVRQVSVPGLTTTFQTTDSLIKALDRLRLQYASENPDPAAQAGCAPTRTTYYVHNGRGYQ